MPRFSILIPVYNVEAYLDDCLQHVLGQSFIDCEVIAVDDGSADRSGQILDEYQETFARRGIPYTIIHQQNQGLGAARNTALDHATGEYVLFLDSDDVLDSTTLSQLNNNLHGEDLLCFNGKRLMEETHTVEAPQPLQAEGPVSGWEYYCRHALASRQFPFVCVVQRCYRRQYLLDASLRFHPGIYHEDNLFTPLACYHARKVSVIPDALYLYRVRPGSIMAHRSLQHRKDLLAIANELAGYFIPITDVDKTVLYRSLTHHYQVTFADSTPKEDRQLLPLVDWNAYRCVSRTKLRHRLLYCALRISPTLFRFMLHIS